MPAAKHSSDKEGRRRASRGELRTRRRRIEQLRTRGLSYEEIADNLGVSISTVQRDVAALRKLEPRRLPSLPMLVGEARVALEDIARETWREFERLQPTKDEPRHLSLQRERVRIHCLGQLGRMWLDFLRFLLELGVVPVSVAARSGEESELNLSDEIRQRVADAWKEARASEEGSPARRVSEDEAGGSADLEIPARDADADRADCLSGLKSGMHAVSSTEHKCSNAGDELGTQSADSTKKSPPSGIRRPVRSGSSAFHRFRKHAASIARALASLE